MTQHLEALEQAQILFRDQVRNRIHGGLQIQQATFGGFFLPIVAVSVAVEDDLVGLFERRLKHAAHSGFQAHAFRQLGLKRHRHFLDGVGGDGVQYGDGEADRLARSDRAELELVAGEGKRRGAVTVASVFRQLRKHLRAQSEEAAFLGGGGRSGDELLEDVRELIASEDGDDGRWRLIRTQTVVVGGVRDGHAEQILMVVHGFDDGRREEQEAQVRVRILTRLEQVHPRGGAHRPVGVFSATVHTGERLLMQKRDQAVVAGDGFEDGHRQLLMVGRDVRRLEDRSDLELTRSHLVVTRFHGHTQTVELFLGFHHEGENTLRDGSEVMVFEFLPFRRLGAEQRAVGLHQVRTRIIEFLVDQEIFLLATHGGIHPLLLGVAQELERFHGGGVQGFVGTQDRRFGIQSLAFPGRIGCRDAKGRSVRILDDESGGCRIPCGVAARFEGGTQAAVREAGCVRLTLDQFLAGEFRHGAAALVRSDEGVVLLGGLTRQRLEPVRVVRRPFLKRPIFHDHGHHIGHIRVQWLMVGDGFLQFLPDAFREAGFERLQGEGVFPEDRGDVHWRGGGLHTADGLDRAESTEILAHYEMLKVECGRLRKNSLD